MVRHRNQKDGLQLAQPDRSGPDPSRETLLDIAEKRGLLLKNGSNCITNNSEPLIGRTAESVLWSTSLTMVHFTLDVLIQHQYAVEISWPVIVTRALQAFPVILLLLYTLHSHPSPSIILPRLPDSIRPIFHQLLFFASSVSAGCYMIYITNDHGYFAIMKRAPPLGCMWIWSVAELDLLWALGSLACCGVFLWSKDYSYL